MKSITSMDLRGLTQRWSDLWLKTDWPTSAVSYGIDALQRTFLYMDIMRRRGNNYIEHVKEGMPPVLVFKYEIVVDGRKLDRPVNYALLRIIDRRAEKIQKAKGGRERRKTAHPSGVTPSMRPIVIIDPRAGHGPGIGGSKRDSEIGMALNAGHPVYFVIFYPYPEPGQTLADVRNAEIIFLETVAERHPEADKPAVIGNCQGGWAAALIGGSRPDVVGPLVFNGSPLSYWGGVDGANPMRYRGGLFGGAWLTSLTNDLGNGRFDGAHLVAGFEDLNPANTYWGKAYNVYANVDTEEKRYLDFERWWGGFYLMNAEEIHFIVDSLFIGNKLESGELELEDGTSVNLKNFKEPIVVFASRGDNITPPQQALNWIVKVYGSVDEVRRNGQVIVYIVHDKIGHLGIFVSASVAKKEHKEIIGSFDMLDYLAPGLYEMVIDDAPAEDGVGQYKVRFEERDFTHIMGLDDGLEDEEDFRPVDELSKKTDQFYRSYISPWVKMASTETTAEIIRKLHPLRASNYMMSDINPLMMPVKIMAERMRTLRQPVSPDNPFIALEKDFSASMTEALNLFRDFRDASQELVFKTMYGSTWMKWMFPEKKGADLSEEKVKKPLPDGQLKKEAESGGFVEGAVRVILAILNADRMLERGEYDLAREIVLGHKQLQKISPFDFKKITKQQVMIVQADETMALAALPKLLKTKARRKDVLRMAKQIISRSGEYASREEYAVYKRIEEILS